MKVFWSWQSDTPGKIGRHFVRDALHDAIEHLKQPEDVEEPLERDVRIQLHLDHDRQGVTGSPRLLETILKKIDISSIFIGDVTPVSRIPGSRRAGQSRQQKRIMNPNVAIELGYALKALTELKVLMVLNEHYGDRRYLPFDIQSNAGPITYRLAPEAGQEQIRSESVKLRSQLIAALREFIREATQISGERLASVESLNVSVRQELQQAWWDAVSARQLNNRPALVSSPSALVHVVPLAALAPLDLDPRSVRPHSRLLKLYDEAEEASDGRQWWAHGPLRSVSGQPNPETRWYGRLLPSGIVEFEVSLGQRIDDDPSIVVKGTQIETKIVDAVDQSLKLLNAINILGPFALGVVLYGLQELEIMDTRRRSRRFREHTLILPLSITEKGALEGGDYMRKAFDVMWINAGFEQSPSFEETRWKGYLE